MRWLSPPVVCLALRVWALGLTHAAPMEYLPGDNVTVVVDSITSVETAIPYDYYSFMPCRPLEVGSAKNLGEVLWWGSMQPSCFAMQMKRDITCAKVCTTVSERPSLEKLQHLIDSGYRSHFVVNNIPAAAVERGRRGNGRLYGHGCPIGAHSTNNSLLVYNHLAFTVKYHKPHGSPSFRVVGFEVVPHSIDSAVIDSDCRPGLGFAATWHPEQIITAWPPNQGTASLSWSYSVRWLEDEASRWTWDQYLEAQVDPKVYWFSIINSLMVAFFMTAMITTIVVRAVRKDMQRYNHPTNADMAQQQIGWKVVHADVFRTPPNAGLLSCYVATGAQLLATIFVSLIVAYFGFFSPTRRGYQLSIAVLVVYTCAGGLGGWVATTMADMFQKRTWRVVLMTGTWFPGHVFAVFCGLNVMLWAKGASSAVPATLSLCLVALWLCVHLPLVVLGGALGRKRLVLTPPQSVGEIPRLLPRQRCYLRPTSMVLCAGVLPFGAAYVQLHFVMSSLWREDFYCGFGFLLIVFLILIITCAEVSIVMVYFQLCYEDYRWWWRAFLCSGSSGFYVFLHSLYFLTTDLHMTGLASRALYISYMAAVSYGTFVVTGTVGFLSSLIFVRGIFSAIHVDDD